MNLGFYSYLGATLAYSLLAILLFFSWRESLQGKLIFISMLISVCWALLAAQIALYNESYLFLYYAFEILRYIAWYVFLLKLFDVALADDEQNSNSYQKFSRKALPISVGLATLFLINELVARVFSLSGQFVLGIVGNVLLAVVGLAIIEQLYRNASARFHWATKYLFLGVGGIFAYDFYLYSDALLFRSIDQDMWDARGIVHMVAVPLIAVSSARNKSWALNIFVSRDIVLNTTVLVAGGSYLLAMAGAGYYLREFGGSWGKFGQVMIITLAVVFLFALLSSAQLRTQTKVFLAKHFYKNKYDYRLEWLRLTEELGEHEENKNHFQNAIEAMAHIVDARAGLLWLRNDKGEFYNAGVWQSKNFYTVLDKNTSLIEYLSANGYVINLREIETHADEYSDLRLPEFLSEIEKSWLIVPLQGTTELIGFMVLANPLVERTINWEDRDLLKTAAKQVASYLMVLMTSAQLSQSKQFEVFSRLSAYMVHDLKNVAAELDLVAINAKKHAANPEFITDAFETVENAASDINRLLEQLRRKRVQSEKKILVDLKEIIQEVVALNRHKLPSPKFKPTLNPCVVSLEKGRLLNVLSHLIDNAQQASMDDGEIIISLSTTENMHSIAIKDDGHGMDENFIRNRLFTPFDTTKGNAGMGIGMFESREFIRQLGGDIVVQSKPGKGSIIVLNIPSVSV